MALAREGHDDGEGVPGYVEGEFRRYLECGILAHRFARARCGDCGHDLLIVFSCKGRGVCPSCNARRMAQTAAPPFARERLEQASDNALIYRFDKPQPDGRTQLRLIPLELIKRLAALVAPPRIHRHRYHGVLAPNAPCARRSVRTQVSPGQLLIEFDPI